MKMKSETFSDLLAQNAADAAEAERLRIALVIRRAACEAMSTDADSPVAAELRRMADFIETSELRTVVEEGTSPGGGS